MLDLRLKSLEIFNRFPDPTWASIEGLDMDNIVTYVKPNTDQKHDWESVPDDIKNTFERLGIPEPSAATWRRRRAVRLRAGLPQHAGHGVQDGHRLLRY